MPTRPREYHRPNNFADALHLLENPDAAPMGGGTRLLAGDVSAKIIVDLQDLNLCRMVFTEDYFFIGATTRLADIEAKLQGSPKALMQQAIRGAGPNTYRNAATLGGIIASREATSELLAVLLILDAQVQMANGEKISLESYLLPDQQPLGLITDINLAWGEGKGALHRVARTPADAPIVAVAGWRPRGDNLRLAAVGITPRPLRLPNVRDDSLNYVILNIQNMVSHPGDFRGSTEYRREMVGVLAKRVISDCLSA
jgi:probable selenate reductase FAD-binding subunit